MKRFSFALLVIAVSTLTYGCAHSIKVEKVPSGSEYDQTPLFDQFDSAQIMADARKLLAYNGPVELMSMNVEAEDDELLGIVGGFKEDIAHGAPAVCFSRDSRFIANAVERALERFKDVDLSGLKFVVASPKEPSKKFQAVLSDRHIQFYYLKITPGGPYRSGSQK